MRQSFLCVYFQGRNNTPSEEDKANITDVREVQYFSDNILSQFPDFKEYIAGKIIRRVMLLKAETWLVEVYESQKGNGYQPDLNKPRTPGESRLFYLLKDKNYFQLNDQPLPCYIDKFKLVGSNVGPRVDLRLKKDVLLISGPCALEGFVSIYDFETAKKIKFTDPNGIIRSKIPSNFIFFTNSIIDEYGNTKGSQLYGVYGKEPVIAVQYGANNDSESPWAIGVFSLKTGHLKELTYFDSY